MKYLVAITTLAFAAPTIGCTAATDDPFEDAALEVEQTIVALEDEEADGAVEELADRDRRDHRRRHHHHRRLLQNFGEDAALDDCRELRASCADEDGMDAGEDAEGSTCREEVRECVRSALEDAFAAMCEEHLAMCEDEGARERPCERIAQRCEDGPRFPHRHGHREPRPFGGERPGHGGAGEERSAETEDNASEEA
ncbi:MAG: hypothetical protein OXT09_33745 [Myxococcales bacterium]|nr:hypothetical protein [Myxococcales bacterium]